MDGLPSPQSTPAKAYVSSMFSLKESPFLPPAMPQDKPLQGQIFYLSPIKIGLTEDPRSCIFSEDFDIDLSICSAIAIFNMTVAIQSMNKEQARETGQLEDRRSRIKQLYKLCLSLIDAAMQDESLSVLALVMCDLITLASLHNLVHLEIAQRSACKEDDLLSSAWIGNLFMTISKIESSLRYPGCPEITSWMQELCHRFVVQAFAVFGHVIRGAAPAA
jgi:hypothetical protein